MSKSLEARTRVEFYDGYAKNLLEGGVTQRDVNEAIQGLISQAQSLLAGKCPRCGAMSIRYVNYMRQEGPSSMPGAWVQYRCSTQPPPGKPRPQGVCDFMVDLKESEASN